MKSGARETNKCCMSTRHESRNEAEDVSASDDCGNGQKENADEKTVVLEVHRIRDMNDDHVMEGHRQGRRKTMKMKTSIARGQWYREK